MLLYAALLLVPALFLFVSVHPKGRHAAAQLLAQLRCKLSSATEALADEPAQQEEELPDQNAPQPCPTPNQLTIDLTQLVQAAAEGQYSSPLSYRSSYTRTTMMFKV